MPHSRLTHVVGLIGRRRAREIRRQQRASQRLQTWAALLLGAVSLALATAMLVAPQAYSYLTRDLPALDLLPLLYGPVDGALLQPSLVYDRNGQELWRLEQPNAMRQFISLSEDSPFAAALIASADPDFLTRPAFSLEPVGPEPGVAVELVQEALFPGGGTGWLHRLRVRLIAAQLVERYGRLQVLDWYANSRVFGHYAVGIQSAAQLYLGKDAADLSLAEAALLAPVAQAPALNPIEAPELATQRQQALLLALLDLGLATEVQVTAALVEAPAIQPMPLPPSSLAPTFTRLALDQVEEQLGFQATQRGGLDIHTSLDLGLQQRMESLLAGQPEAQAVVLDPATGELLVMLGRADLAQHSPGSTLSPFAYLSAFAQGQAPASLAWDAPSRVMTGLGDYANPDGTFHGPVTLRQALANDYLVVSLQTLEQAGAENAWAAARQSGLSSFHAEGPQALLGQAPASLLELAQAYATLANLGQRTSGQVPSAFFAVIGPDGGLLVNGASGQNQSVLAPELAYLVTDVLSDSGARLDPAWRQAMSSVGRPVALQLGHAQGQVGLWAIGYSPQRVLVMWFPSAEGAPDMWAQAFQAAHAGLPIQNWTVPGGLASAIVCVPSGLLPTADCPETRRELFLAGYLPTTTDDLYQRLAINQHSQRLATVFSPADFIEEQVFLRVPADVQEWAFGAGLSLPPADYDSVLLASSSEGGPQISAPLSFSAHAGMLAIHGSTGTDILGYRLLVGRGLYPFEWVEIAAGQNAVEAGLLAEWDSGGLSGAYAIQLQVLHADGRLERAYTIVSLN